MLEILLAIAVVILFTRIASQSERSPLAWGGIALAVCVVSLLIPLPFLRILIAAGITFALMVVVAPKRG